MEINYEKAFKKLVEQIKLESEWAKEAYEEDASTRNRGMVFAYDSIKSLAIELENGTFEFEEDIVDDEEES